MPTVTLRPSADGALLQNSIHPTTPTTHFDKVDEEVPNDATDYVYSPTPTGAYRDSFVKPSSGIPSGSTINSVTIYHRLRTTLSELRYCGAVCTLLRDSLGNVVVSFPFIQAVWTTVSVLYTTSPFTGSAWTLAEVEGLQIGTQCESIMDEEYTSGQGYCSTIWLVIDYTLPPVLGASTVVFQQMVEAILNCRINHCLPHSNVVG